MLTYSDFQEEFVKHYYKKFHNKQKALSLDQIKDKILQKWGSYERNQLLNFYIIYCLNKNVKHIDLEDLGFREWFSENMCLNFDEGDEEESVKFCKECKKQFKKKTNPLSLKFRIQYIPERDDDDELKTPKKEQMEKAQMETAVKGDSAQKQDKRQEEKNSDDRGKEKRFLKKRSNRKVERQHFSDLVDSLQLARQRLSPIDILFQLPFDKQQLKTKKITKSRAVK